MMMICIPPIPYRRNCLLFIVSVCVSITELRAKKEFQTIVRALAERNGIKMPEDKLLLEANKWELSHGGLTGRTAQQFIDHLLGAAEE